MKQQREAKSMKPLWKVKSFEQHILTTADREGDTNRQTKSVSNAQDKQTHGHGHGHGTARYGTVHDSTGEQSRQGDAETDKQTRRHKAQNTTTNHSTPQRNPPLTACPTAYCCHAVACETLRLAVHLPRRRARARSNIVSSCVVQTRFFCKTTCRKCKIPDANTAPTKEIDERVR